MTLELFVLLMIFAHYVGDYVLQSNHLSETKGKEWYSMLVHCILYTGSVGCVLGYHISSIPYFGLAAMFVSHWIMDTWKCRGLEKDKCKWKWIERSYLYADQSFHFVILMSLILWYK